ncbi:MAG: peptidoglycan-binding protein [Bryobacteraceae bacterium]|jgi:peptidoglycan L-alanyl-D-glutamate endopeptidase CwlK
MNIVPLIPDITVEIATRMLPYAPRVNIESNLPLVLSALVTPCLADKPMALMALATIGAETGAFLPVSEGQDRLNTSSGGHPFDLYDSRADLGNLGPPDGERFKGRGFIQLTGRSNYALRGAAIGLGNQLIDDPELANEPSVAARLLASFLKLHESKIRAALTANDLREARRLVNGGSNGLAAFEAAYSIGLALLRIQYSNTRCTP